MYIKKYLMVFAFVIGVFMLLPSSVFANGALFKIGSSQYTVDGQNKTMDVAPFTENNRTFLPIRYLADALGITSDNITWDSANQAVTLTKGDKVVQVTIGSKILKVNGSNILMDVSPKMVNDRIFLPLAWLAQAFDVNLSWDENTHSIGVGDVNVNYGQQVSANDIANYVSICSGIGKTLTDAASMLIDVKDSIAQGNDYNYDLNNLYTSIVNAQNYFKSITYPTGCEQCYNYLNLSFDEIRKTILDAESATSYMNSGDYSDASNQLSQMSSDINSFIEYSAKCVAALKEVMRIYSIQ